jgi:hypothetical protein
MKFIETSNLIFDGWVCCSVSMLVPVYSCLMDFKGYIIDVSASLICENGYVPDQQRLNLGYLLPDQGLVP